MSKISSDSTHPNYPFVSIKYSHVIFKSGKKTVRCIASDDGRVMIAVEVSVRLEINVFLYVLSDIRTRLFLNSFIA